MPSRVIVEAIIDADLDFRGAAGKPMFEATHLVHAELTRYLSRFDHAYSLSPLVCDPAKNHVQALVRQALDLDTDPGDRMGMFEEAKKKLSALGSCDCDVRQIIPLAEPISASK